MIVYVHMCVWNNIITTASKLQNFQAPVEGSIHFDLTQCQLLVVYPSKKY